MALVDSVELVARQEELKPAEDVLQRAVSAAFQKAGPLGLQVKDLLNGTWLGHPLHPAATDIPIGAWTAALVMDTIDAATGRDDLAPGADAAVALGLAGAVGSALSGLADWQYLGGESRRVGFVHGVLNLSATLLYAASLLLRRSGARGAGQAVAGLGYAAVFASAYLGGHLISGYRVGVDRSAGARVPKKWTAVLPEAELPEGQLKRVTVRNTRVLLVRQNGQIYALAEVCSHLGGPLSEGHLQDGCVVCPWHGSTFRLADGSIVHGPATFPQPSFEARVNEGQIEVRAREE